MLNCGSFQAWERVNWKLFLSYSTTNDRLLPGEAVKENPMFLGQHSFLIVFKWALKQGRGRNERDWTKLLSNLFYKFSKFLAQEHSNYQKIGTFFTYCEYIDALATKPSQTTMNQKNLFVVSVISGLNTIILVLKTCQMSAQIKNQPWSTQRDLVWC